MAKAAAGRQFDRGCGPRAPTSAGSGDAPVSRRLPPPRVKAPVLVSSLTSVEICSEMRPLDSTTGVKERPTPNCLNSMVMLPCWSRPAGTGNSPPARNFAVSPDTAVRLGSASVCARPIRSSACTMP